MTTAAILRDVPDSFESERLVIRAPRPGDGAALNEAVVESFDELHRWLLWAKERPSLDESEKIVRELHVKFLERVDLVFLLFERASGALVGGSGLHQIDWNVPKFEIGYWGRTRFSKRGFIGEAVAEIARVAFERLGAQRVQIKCDPQNARSRSVAERAGFRLEGELINDGRTPQGTLRNTLVFARTP